MSEIIRKIEDARIGQHVYTPRFCDVEVSAIFDDEQEARACGYTSETYYGRCALNGAYLDDEDVLPVTILGKHVGINCMIFCVCPWRT